MGEAGAGTRMRPRGLRGNLRLGPRGSEESTSHTHAHTCTLVIYSQGTCSHTHTLTYTHVHTLTLTTLILVACSHTHTCMLTLTCCHTWTHRGTSSHTCLYIHVHTQTHTCSHTHALTYSSPRLPFTRYAWGWAWWGGPEEGGIWEGVGGQAEVGTMQLGKVGVGISRPQAGAQDKQTTD